MVPGGGPIWRCFLFTKNILAGLPIDVFNDGHHRRDFTYVDDIVKGVLAAVDHAARPDPAWDSDDRIPAPVTFHTGFIISAIRHPSLCCAISRCWNNALGRKAQKNLLPMQPGDVPDTWADVEALIKDVGYRPGTELQTV